MVALKELDFMSCYFKIFKEMQKEEMALALGYHQHYFYSLKFKGFRDKKT